MNIRVGTGFDAHAFGPGDSVALGGLRIAHTRGVVAHSDGDVLLHALCDALLGSMGLGDFGQQFPDSDPQWKGVASERFVTAVMLMLKQRGYAVGNADITLLAQLPRIAAHRDAIRMRVAQLLDVEPGQVCIKATTTEYLGFIGRSEGLAALATVLISRPP